MAVLPKRLSKSTKVTVCLIQPLLKRFIRRLLVAEVFPLICEDEGKLRRSPGGEVCEAQDIVPTRICGGG